MRGEQQVRTEFFLHLMLCLAVLGTSQVCGQTPDDQPSLLERLHAAEARIRQLETQFHMGQTDSPTPASATTSELPAPLRASGPDWTVGYDQGFFIDPADEERHPFGLRINGRMQFRHTAFARDVSQWTDQAGVMRPVTNRNDFEIERGRLEFRGFFLDPNLRFFLNLDGDTDDSHTVIFHDFWVNYEFSDAFDLYFGKAFVPGSRDWLNGAARTRLADRSMATTFFRPDRTLGIWAIGEPMEDLYYRVMLGNGFNTTDLTPSEVDLQFAYSASMWFNLGNYGQGYSDLEWHCEPAAQFGHSFTFAPTSGEDNAGGAVAEENFLRLSDGTQLTQPGALAPGVMVDHFDIYLYTVDAAFKYRGFSANGEYFFRWLQSIRGTGPLPVARLFAHGFYLEVGYFLVPRKLELNGRTSQVFGEFGDAQEYAGGVNWFINGTHNWKVTFDVTKLNDSPASNSGVNLRAGDDGLLFRTQLQAAF